MSRRWDDRNYHRKGSSSYRGEDWYPREDDSTSKQRDRSRSRSRSRSKSPQGLHVSPHNSYSVNAIKEKSFGTNRSKVETKKKIQMKLSSSTKTSVNVQKLLKPKLTVAAVFNDDDDDEPEEMPAEARMRMKNIGRETPTSAGPNSFGKTKQGFCDSKKMFEKSLKKAMEEAND